MPWLEALVAALGSAAMAMALSSLGNMLGWGRRATTVDTITLALVAGGCAAGSILGESGHYAVAGSIVGITVGIIAGALTKRLVAP